MAENTSPKQSHQPAPPVPEAWVKTELARHPQRPYPMDYIQALFTDFSEIHGDRQFADDPAMTAGMARFHGQPVMVIANLKGRSVKERVARKFGSPDPEGYRKALRAMKIAEKFNRPVFTFIDCAGANPGLGAEERGQAEAIARNLLEMSRLRVPTIATITGEGGSGGALALAVADRVLMLENAIYSVISPEGCASIMWKDSSPQTGCSHSSPLHRHRRQNARLRGRGHPRARRRHPQRPRPRHEHPRRAPHRPPRNAPGPLTRRPPGRPATTSSAT